MLTGTKRGKNNEALDAPFMRTSKVLRTGEQQKNVDSERDAGRHGGLLEDEEERTDKERREEAYLRLEAENARLARIVRDIQAGEAARGKGMGTGSMILGGGNALTMPSIRNASHCG
jgi:hypothetical protein